MSAPDFIAALGDDNVPWDEVIRDQYGNRIDITGGTVVAHFRAKNKGTPEVTVSGSVAGTAPLTFARVVLTAAGALAAAGDFDVFFRVTIVGETVTYPDRSAYEAGSPTPGPRYLWLQVNEPL